jgi:hypothetical protein
VSPDEKGEPDLSAFLKNNIRPLPAWQEIVDFSQSSIPALDRPFRHPRERGSDLVNRIPHDSFKALDRPLRGAQGRGRVSDRGPRALFARRA